MEHLVLKSMGLSKGSCKSTKAAGELNGPEDCELCETDMIFVLPFKYSGNPY
jgi:hypothetical protein